MRAVLPILICLAAMPAQAEPPAPKAGVKAAAAVIGCASLANHRMLMNESPGAAASARLADPKADHLGCAAIAPDTVAGIADHVVLDGRAYDCLTLQSTSVCQWVTGGSLAPVGRKAAETGKAKR